MPRSSSLLCLALVLLTAASAAPPRLHPEPTSPYDLVVRGALAGLPPGETRYVAWNDLRALPTRELVLDGEFVPGPQTVTVVAVAELWRALSPAPEADALLAFCTDGYASLFTRAFIDQHHPFVVLEINGAGPAQWPPAGLSFNPGPYVISVAEALSPGVGTVLDIGHKRPWGVTVLEFVAQADRFAAWHTGAWATLSARAEAGRTLWADSCFSCHAGPAGGPGGTKGGRPFAILAAHAAHQPDYFKRYVRDPRGVNPAAKMEPHPHYTDAQLDALIAFITAEPR